jgi:hypothetical protein
LTGDDNLEACFRCLRHFIEKAISTMLRNTPALVVVAMIMILMTSQTAPDWQLQIGESGASSRYNFNLELERLVCKQTALAA